MKTAGNVLIFISIMIGLLASGGLIASGSLTNPVTWILFAVGVATETWLLRMIYNAKSRKHEDSE